MVKIIIIYLAMAASEAHLFATVAITCGIFIVV